MEAEAGDIVLLSIAGFVAFWFVIQSVIARMSGWAQLAEYYRHDGPFDGYKRRFQSITMTSGSLPPVAYANTITVDADTRAVYLSPFIFFRPFHPAIVIPHTDIEASEGRRFLVLPTVELRTNRAPEIKIALSPAVAKWIDAAADGQWQGARVLALLRDIRI